MLKSEINAHGLHAFEELVHQGGNDGKQGLLELYIIFLGHLDSWKAIHSTN